MKSLLRGLILLVSIAFIASSCSKKSLPPVVTEVKELVNVDTQIVYRDTVIYAPSDSIGVQIPVAQLKEGLEVQDKSNQSSIHIKVNKGRLNATCVCDTLGIQALMEDKYIKTSTEKTITQTQLVKERFTPWYIKILAWVGFFTLLYVVYFILKPRKF